MFVMDSCCQLSLATVFSLNDTKQICRHASLSLSVYKRQKRKIISLQVEIEVVSVVQLVTSNNLKGHKLAGSPSSCQSKKGDCITLSNVDVSISQALS